MTDSAEPRNELERALAETQRGERSSTEFVQLLVQQPLFVLVSKPWDGRSLPDPDMRMLLVSDGPNREQAMLAVFTDGSRAEAFIDQAPGFTLARMPAILAFLGVREDHGVIVNPNDSLTMKLLPTAAQIVRDAAKQMLEQLRSAHAAAFTDPSPSSGD